MPLLETRKLTAHYGDFQALFDIDTHLDEGEIVAIIGANGAGKSTYLKSIAGLISGRAESVIFSGKPIGGTSAASVVKLGLSLVPEGRRLFPSLTVEENLLIGGDGSAAGGRWTLDGVYGLFPMLREFRNRPSTTLSGGQQQMVAIGRGLMSNPRVLLCDEISLGLAPIVIRDIYQAIPRIKASGISLILVEQDVVQAMAVADRVYCFQEGSLSLAGRSSELTREQIHAAYFGH
ncbi:MAG TPA: ABC transporter ATP-binding protein [Xanthobacteraceae bacterium]|nr:ABC transporter ATP-binding protein [Xanthobacteraceae bacterium]